LTWCTIVLGTQSWKLDRPPYFSREEGDRWAHSEVFICPACRVLWASLHFEADPLVWPTGAFCERCEPPDEPHYRRWHPVPGSLLQSVGWGIIDTGLLSILPEPLVRREFFLTINREGIE